MRRINWLLTGGFLLVFVAVFSYAYFFSRWPITRDVPWVPLVMFLGAAAMLIAGWRRAGGRRILASLVALAGFGFMVFFIVFVSVGTRMIPHSGGAPAIGRKAPDFTLPDSAHHTVAFSGLLAKPGARGVLIIFYRGYW
jgi:hypothetical protein